MAGGLKGTACKSDVSRCTDSSEDVSEFSRIDDSEESGESSEESNQDGTNTSSDEKS